MHYSERRQKQNTVERLHFGWGLSNAQGSTHYQPQRRGGGHMAGVHGAWIHALRP